MGPPQGKGPASANGKTNSDRGPLVFPGPPSPTGYFNPIKNHSNRKKRFVKNPLSASAFGQNKTLKLRQNNFVINTLKHYLESRPPMVRHHECVFLNANGTPITRFGIGYIITKHAQKASLQCSTLDKKTIGPHTFRHSTAMHLLQAGNDINMVRLWLGHANINTTHIYFEIDIAMKQKILNTTQSPRSDKEKTKCPKWKNPEILKWLDELTQRSAKNNPTLSVSM
jgi:hypothetical protein